MTDGEAPDILSCRLSEQGRERPVGRCRSVIFRPQPRAQHGKFEVDFGQRLGPLMHEGGCGLEDGIAAGGAFFVGEAALGR